MDDEKILNQGVRLALELGIRLKIELEGVDILLESSSSILSIKPSNIW